MIYLLSYLIGSIPFGYLIAKFFLGRDIQKEGSGNIGATNVTRVLGKRYGIVTLCLDIAKGIVVFLLAQKFNVDIYVACYLAIMGHIFPLWLGFKGGKGVATTVSILFCVAPKVAVFSFSVWLLVFLIFRISSLAALASSVSAPLIAFLLFRNDNQIIYFVLLLSLTLLATHAKNISRLLKGKETKFNNFFKQKEENEKTK
jgi:glycerol-3-phosphate acyltransferase PlsY